MTIVKHIPNAITSMNLVCGILGVVFAFKGRFDLAFPLMIVAAVFDFCDGLSARLLGAYSEMGKELDSLCDAVSFGVLPSVMLYNLLKTCWFAEPALCYVPLLIAVFSALRLAKFNIDEEQHSSFLGLPTPACALLCGSLCYFVASEPASPIAILFASSWFVPALSIVLCALLVCRMPMFSLKFSKNDSAQLKSKRLTFGVAVAICAAYTALSASNWSLAVVLIIGSYIVLNAAFALFAKNQ